MVGADVGSIAGGGRYDNLVGMFSKSNTQIPCVGASVGVGRVFSILEAKALADPESVRPSPTQVYVAVAGGEMTVERMEILNKLWEGGICAEMSYKKNLKVLDQFAFCESNRIPWAVVLGPSEQEQGLVKIRSIADRSEKFVKLEDLIEELETLMLAGSLALLAL